MSPGTRLSGSNDLNAKLMDFRKGRTKDVSCLSQLRTETGAKYLSGEMMVGLNELTSVRGFMNYYQAKVRQYPGSYWILFNSKLDSCQTIAPTQNF